MSDWKDAATELGGSVSSHLQNSPRAHACASALRRWGADAGADAAMARWQWSPPHYCQHTAPVNDCGQHCCPHTAHTPHPLHASHLSMIVASIAAPTWPALLPPHHTPVNDGGQHVQEVRAPRVADVVGGLQGTQHTTGPLVAAWKTTPAGSFSRLAPPPASCPAPHPLLHLGLLKPPPSCTHARAHAHTHAHAAAHRAHPLRVQHVPQPDVQVLVACCGGTVWS